MKIVPAVKNRLGVASIIVMLLSGCSSLSPEQEGPTRNSLDSMANNAVAALFKEKPEAKEVFDKSVGYVVLDMTIAKIPVVGTGSGYGVVIDKRKKSHSYIQVSQFEIGGGMGAEKYKVVIIFDDEKLIERVAAGAWHYGSGATAAASGNVSSEGTDKGYKAFKLTESGACVRVTVRMAKAKPYLPN